MHRNPETLTAFFSSGTKRLLTFLTFTFSTRGERNKIFTMLTVPTSSFSQPQAGLPDSGSNLDSPRPESNLNFQKSPKFPAHRIRTLRHPPPSPISYLGFLL